MLLILPEWADQEAASFQQLRRNGQIVLHLDHGQVVKIELNGVVRAPVNLPVDKAQRLP